MLEIKNKDYDLNSLDYIMIVDYNYKIVYDTRFDETMMKKNNTIKAEEVQGKKLFKVFPNLKKEHSNIVRTMETGQPWVLKRQSFIDFNGKEYLTNSITLPIKRKDEVVGVVELSMDAEDSDDVSISIKDDLFDSIVKKYKARTEVADFKKILTINRTMKDTINKAKILSKLPFPILIYGETGTGKELFAQAMMNYLGVPKKRRIVQNCAAIPVNLMESIFFGTEEGAYTGAIKRKGLFDLADKGVIFLDEINSIPYNVQAKLLRVIQDGSFRPIGSNTDRKVNCKIIAAMNILPEEAIEKNILRKDLFYRFSAGLITIPPLRDREDDIRMFINYFIEEFAKLYDKNIMGMDPNLKNFFYSYYWNGNVRELKNAIESMVGMTNGNILTVDSLPDYIKTIYRCKFINKENNIEVEDDRGIDKNEKLTLFLTNSNGEIKTYDDLMKEFESRIIKVVLNQTGNNKSKAAKLLNMPRQTLNYRIKKYNK